MRTFVFLLQTKNKKNLTNQLLINYINYLKNLKKNGNLMLCGPFVDNDGALQVISANSKTDAIKLFEQDPFIQQKYYEKYIVHELIQADESNNWLANHSQTIQNKKL